MFLAGELLMAQMQLIQDFNTATSSEARSTLFLLAISQSYVRALDELTHPPFLAACFVADPTNSSMWATYGSVFTMALLEIRSPICRTRSAAPGLNLWHYRLAQWCGNGDGAGLFLSTPCLL